MTPSTRDSIRALIKAQGFTQAQFAARLGIHPSQLSSYLSGKADIYASLFAKILKELGIDLELLLAQSTKSWDASKQAAADPLSPGLADKMAILFQKLPSGERETSRRFFRRLQSLSERSS